MGFVVVLVALWCVCVNIRVNVFVRVCGPMTVMAVQPVSIGEDILKCNVSGLTWEGNRSKELL